METLRVRWEGAQLVNHSLAHVNREICLRLARLPGVKLSLLPTEHDTLTSDAYPLVDQVISLYHSELPGVDFHIGHQWPPNLIRPPEGRWIIFQPWEYGAAPVEWLPPMLYEADEIWVYSEYNKQTYIESGIPAEKLFVLPLGVDPARHTPDGDRYRLKTEKKFKFLFVGGTIWRKGIDTLLRAYVSTFTRSDDVTLVIKDFGTRSFYGGQTNREMIDRIADQPNAPEILYLDDDLSEAEMASLYRACDCLVHPYRGEGFGLPILEAMACGLPVIVPDDGPAMEYTTLASAFHIPSTRVAMEQKYVGDIETVAFPEFIDVNETVLRKTMRGAYENRGAVREAGRAASEHVLRSYTWDATVRRLHDHLLSARIPDTVTTSTDWVAEARAKLAAGDVQTSAWLWKRALREEPNHFEALFTHGTLCTLLRRHGEAITHLTKCLAQTTEPALLQNLHHNLGLNQLELLQFPEAVKNFTRALAFGDSEVSRDALAHAHGEAARRRPVGNPQAQNPEQLLRSVAHAFEAPADELRARRRQWVSLFKAGEAVLDIGCGDGILMELLRDRGVHSEGIDLDPVKVAIAKGRGLHVTCARAEEYFKGKTATHDGVFLGHIVEHLPPQDVLELLLQAVRALKPGGRLVILTPHIRNETVQEHFWLDVTHIRPYPRLLMIEMLRAVGLEIAESGFLEDDQEYYVVGKVAAVSVVWESPILNTSGYASEGKTHIEALRPFPYVLSLVLRESGPRTDLYSDDFVRYVYALVNNNHDSPLVHVQFLPGHHFTAPKAPISIGRTMFETDRIPEDWVYKCNQLSEIWTPSHFNRETFIASGVVAQKIRVIPSPLDFDFYRPQEGREAFRQTHRDLRSFVFLSIFDWNFRKGWDILVQAFAEEFHPKEDVSLLLKVSRLFKTDPVVEILRCLQRLGRHVSDVANIQVISGFLSETEVRELYIGSDAFVLPTRGEGWGRPFMEAMAMGLPTIGTRWGGNTEFMDDQNSFLIDIDGLEAVDEEMEYVFYRGHRWARPSVSATRRQMRHVYENYRDAKSRTESARQDLVRKYSSSRIAEQMHRRIQELVLEM